ncbi:MAG: AAA family ATPase [Caldilineaceae bacterium]
MNIKPAKRNELERLFQEFASGYLKSAEGKALINDLRQAHEDAQKNYSQILEQAKQGNESSDEILLKLLPYTNNANNRWRGAWLHPLPAFQGDVRKWYEAAGWTKGTDWPTVAHTIFTFVQQCKEQPDQLATACKDFSQSPYSKGFQSATLTPILHALRPNDFLLFNNRVRHALNYFIGSSFTQSIADYPAANEALHQMLADLADFLQKYAIRRLFLADLFALFCHWLAVVKKYPFRQSRYWRINLGTDIWLWEEWQEGNFVALPWDDLGDISHLKRAEFEQLRNSLVTQHIDWSKRELDQVWKFARQLSEGDRVAVELDGKAVLGIGSVTDGYYFVPEIGYGHRLPVQWEDKTSRELTLPPLTTALAESNENDFATLTHAASIDLRSILPQPALVEPPPVLRETRPPYGTNELEATNPELPLISHDSLNDNSQTLTQTAALTFLDETTLATWIAAIERKGQAIFFGPPGVGKTFIATQLAKHLSSSIPAHVADEVIGNSQLSTRNSLGFWDLVQFHPAYEYEDFVQGIRPVSKGGGVEFSVLPGRFLEFCHRAEGQSGRCVLVIDEINRANLSRVFGELMYLLEYRDQSVRLAADGAAFHIPPNVRLLGTMNTADRSIALVDHALRRRFVFIHLTPNYDVLRRFAAHYALDFPMEKLITTLQRLNQRIGDRNYELGHSFFLTPNLPSELESIWHLEIEPYLEEYFFDQPDEVENWRWERLATLFG